MTAGPSGQRVQLDHTPVIVTREATHDDFERYFAEVFDEMSPLSRQMRFFSPVRELPPAVRERLSKIDGTINGAIIAFDAADHGDPTPDGHPEGKAVGFARWMSPAEGTPELSVVVIDEYQGMGIGSRLMDALIALGRKRGVRRMIAEVLRENTPMRALINRYRAVIQPSGDPRVVRYRIDI